MNSLNHKRFIGWSVETTGKIVEVKTLFSKMLTKDNNVIYLPNSEILGNSVITEYRNDGGSYIYPLNITAQADVPADKILTMANKLIDIMPRYTKKMRAFSTFIALSVRSMRLSTDKPSFLPVLPPGFLSFIICSQNLLSLKNFLDP